MNPLLFILMRTDLDSLNSGKAMAQAAHAANACELKFEELMTSMLMDETKQSAMKELNSAYHAWKNQTVQGFGTTIVLGGPMVSIESDVAELKQKDYLADIIHDPTYPLRDGSVTHLIPLNTCAYVFAANKDDPVLTAALNKYELHP